MLHTSMMVTRKFNGVWIPKEIWLDKTLNFIEKVLIIEIDSLDNDTGCYASNSYFAEFFDTSDRNIRRFISSLSEKGWILIHNPDSRKRTIRINPDKTVLVTRTKPSGQPGQNRPLLNNNTEENNTENKLTAPADRARDLIDLFKGIRQSYEQLFKRKHEWAAAHRLLKTISFEELKHIIEFLPQSNSTPYAPTITSPSELEEKLEKLRAFWTKEKAKSNKVAQKFSFSK